MSRSTKQNRFQGPAASLLKEAGWQRPQHSQDQFYQQVLDVAEQIIDGLKLSRDQIRHLAQTPTSANAMTTQVTSQLGERYMVALRALVTAEDYADQGTITQVCQNVITQLSPEFFAEYGLSTTAIQAGFREAASQELQPATR